MGCSASNAKKKKGGKLVDLPQSTSFKSSSLNLFKRMYKIEPKVLGGGAFGKVFKGHEIKNPSVKVAIKVIDKKHVSKNIGLIKSECQILRNLDHPNIINYRDVYESPNSVYIVQELCEGRDLFHIYCKKSIVMNEYDCAKLAKNLLKALIHCHSEGIVHRDIKLENIMFTDEDESDFKSVKLIDFGLAARYQGVKSTKMDSMVGSPYFTAPEVFEEKYDEKCDVWSLGVVIYVLLSGEYPYTADSVSLLYETIKARDVKFPFSKWELNSDHVQDLLSKMLDRSPNTRISFEECLQHDWFESIKNKEISENDGSEDMNEVMESLQRYNALTILHKEAMSVYVKSLNHKEISKLEDIFSELDIDNTGMITPKELQTSLKNLGKDTSAKEIKEIISKVDYLGNGKINYSEFLAATVSVKDLLSEEQIATLFENFDTDGSGIITTDNLKEAFAKNGKQLSEEEIGEIMTQHDLEKNSVLTYKEFKAMMLQNGEF